MINHTRFNFCVSAFQITPNHFKSLEDYKYLLMFGLVSGFYTCFFLSQKVPGHHAQELSYIRLDLVFVINKYKASPTDRLFFICLFIRRFFIIIIVNRYLLISVFCFLFFVSFFVFFWGGGGM